MIFINHGGIPSQHWPHKQCLSEPPALHFTQEFIQGGTPA